MTACEKTLGDDTDQFAIFYMALRNKFNDYVNETDVNKKGMIVGHMITNYLQCSGSVPYPVEFKKLPLNLLKHGVILQSLFIQKVLTATKAFPTWSCPMQLKE